jgi:hypothetical protein
LFEISPHKIMRTPIAHWRKVSSALDRGVGHAITRRTVNSTKHPRRTLVMDIFGFLAIVMLLFEMIAKIGDSDSAELSA